MVLDKGIMLFRYVQVRHYKTKPCGTEHCWPRQCVLLSSVSCLAVLDCKAEARHCHAASALYMTSVLPLPALFHPRRRRTYLRSTTSSTWPSACCTAARPARTRVRVAWQGWPALRHMCSHGRGGACVAQCTARGRIHALLCMPFHVQFAHCSVACLAHCSVACLAELHVRPSPPAPPCLLQSSCCLPS